MSRTPPKAGSVRVAAIRVGARHAHGCTQCSARYTDSCAVTDVNGRCSTCHRGRARSHWDRDSDPRLCCRADSVPTDAGERALYALAGPGPWWRCHTCSRTHPFQPGSDRR